MFRSCSKAVGICTGKDSVDLCGVPGRVRDAQAEPEGESSRKSNPSKG